MHRLSNLKKQKKYASVFCYERTKRMDFIDRRKRYNRLWTMVFWPEATVEGYNVLMLDLFLTNMHLFTSQDVN